MTTQYTPTEKLHTCQVCTLSNAMKQCHACQFYTPTQTDQLKAQIEQLTAALHQIYKIANTGKDQRTDRIGIMNIANTAIG